MCGISGVVRFDQKPVQQTLISRMMQEMKHRGPDDEGCFFEDNIGLGFVRLSILDLSPAGHQPMFSQDGRYVMVFNGEIFNYLELREELQKKGHHFKTRTDSEVLLAAYVEWGVQCLGWLNGMWAFAIYDRKKKSMFAARDRYGIKPFYYHLNEGSFVFASEIPPILGTLGRRPTPYHQAIFDYLVFNRTDQSEHTFFVEVKKLQHGCYMLIEQGKAEIVKWYNLRSKVEASEAFQRPEEFRELLSSSIGLRLRSDVPVGVCLSGGLDSSTIVSTLLQDYQKEDLKTFSAVYGSGKHGDEMEFIKEYEHSLRNMYFINPSAESLRQDFKKFVKIHGEPFPSTSPYAQYKVMELAKDHVVVTLDGQGADEELAGYHYFYGFFFKDLLRKGKLGKLGSEIFSYLAEHRSLYGIKSFLYFLLPQQLRTNVRVGNIGYLNQDFSNAHKRENGISNNLYAANTLNDALLDHFEYKLEHLLKWEDRNSMGASLEARVPFLDYRLVEKVLATSGELMIRNGTTKHLLRESMKGRLPEKIRTRKDKIGFGTPENEWFRTKEWQQIIAEVLTSKSFKERNMINPDVAMTKYKQYLGDKANISREIWKWVHLEYWSREFID